MSDHFDDLIGEIDDPRERERLRRVHELLLAVEPPPEVSAALRVVPTMPPASSVRQLPQRRRRRLALLAAALAVVAFGSGYLIGERDGSVERTIEMASTSESLDASGTIEVLSEDKAGNWPMNLIVDGLEPSRDRDDYYELWLTRDGKLADTCGRFIVVEGENTIELTVPYPLRRYDGWVVTRHGSDEPLLST